MFGKKINEAEVKNLINYEITELKLEIEKLKTHINSLRGFVNRKLSNHHDEDEDDLEKPKREMNKRDRMFVLE